MKIYLSRIKRTYSIFDCHYEYSDIFDELLRQSEYLFIIYGIDEHDLFTVKDIFNQILFKLHKNGKIYFNNTLIANCNYTII